MSVRRVSPRLRPSASGLTMALVLGSCLGSMAVLSSVGNEAAAADPPQPSSTTSTTSAPPTTTPATTAPPSTTPTSAPATTTTSSLPRTAAPTTTTAVPQTTGLPPTRTTAPQSQSGSSGPVALAVVVSTGDGLVVQSTDGTQSPAQVGQRLQPGDQLSTTGTPSSSSAAHPATIRWLQGGTTDIYDATPRIFVRGHRSVPPIATTIVINADPTPTLKVSQGFARFWFSSGEKGWYSFVASTEAVVATVRGTDFTIGDDASTRTSTVGVTQDAVEVAPVNPSLQPFQLSAGSQVQVTPDRVGPITPLADQSANSAKKPSARSTTTTLVLWLVGLLLTVAVASAAVGLTSLWRDRRRGGPARPARRLSWPGRPARKRRQAPPVPALPPRPVVTPDLSFAHAGPPGATGWVTLPSGPSGEVTEPVPETRSPSASGSDGQSAWEPTHRVPPEGMKARALPVAAAGDVASLDPDLAVRVVEHRGDWANVLSADGWSGWVGARKLRERPDSG